MKTSKRSIIVANELKKVFPEILSKVIISRDFGQITVTEVEISGDLSYALIFFTSFISGKNQLLTLEKNRNKLAFELVKKLKLPKKLELRFKVDSSKKIMDKLTKI